MAETTKEMLRVIMVESDLSNRQDLRMLLTAVEMVKDIVHAPSMRDAEKRLASEDYDICFVGAGLSLEAQIDFIKFLSGGTLRRPVAIVAVLKKHDKRPVIDLVKAGAHGVLLMPINLEGLQSVMEVALEALGDQVAGKPRRSVEEVTSLPKLLERVAKRLDQLASKIKEEQSGVEVRSDISTEAVKEALLQALAATGGTEEEVNAQMIKWLTRQAEKKK